MFNFHFSIPVDRSNSWSSGRRRDQEADLASRHPRPRRHRSARTQVRKQTGYNQFLKLILTTSVSVNNPKQIPARSVFSINEYLVSSCFVLCYK